MAVFDLKAIHALVVMDLVETTVKLVRQYVAHRRGTGNDKTYIGVGLMPTHVSAWD